MNCGRRGRFVVTFLWLADTYGRLFIVVCDEKMTTGVRSKIARVQTQRSEITKITTLLTLLRQTCLVFASQWLQTRQTLRLCALLLPTSRQSVKPSVGLWRETSCRSH